MYIYFYRLVDCYVGTGSDWSDPGQFEVIFLSSGLKLETKNSDLGSFFIIYIYSETEILDLITNRRATFRRRRTMLDSTLASFLVQRPSTNIQTMGESSRQFAQERNWFTHNGRSNYVPNTVYKDSCLGAMGLSARIVCKRIKKNGGGGERG